MLYAMFCYTYGLLLYAIHCLYVLYAIKMGVAAICYNHCLVSAICYVLLNGLCHMLLVTPLGPYLLYVSMILGSIK